MKILTWTAGALFFLGVALTTSLIVDKEGATRVIDAVIPLGASAGTDAKGFDKAIRLVKTNFLFYGTVTFAAGFLWAMCAKRGRRRRFSRAPRVPAAEGARAPRSALPAAQPTQDFLNQLEINWKTFASYMQDILHRKIKELDEVPQKALKEMTGQAAALWKALEEVKRSVALARSELKETSQGIQERIAMALGEAVKKKDHAPQASVSTEPLIKRLEKGLGESMERFSRVEERIARLTESVEAGRKKPTAAATDDPNRYLITLPLLAAPTDSALTSVLLLRRRFFLQRGTEPLAGFFDVVAQRALGRIGISRPQRVEHRRVPLDDLLQRMVRFRHRQECRRGQAHAVPDLLKQAIARRFDDGEMKREVCFNRAAMISSRSGSTHRREQPLELLQRRRVDANCRVPCRETLEDRADRIQLHQFLDRNLANDRTAKRGADDESEQIEIAQRLPHRRLADAELLRNAHLDDAFAGRQAAVENLFDQLVANLIAEDAPLPTRAFCAYHFWDPFAGSA
jgi:hypothetical protein